MAAPVRVDSVDLRIGAVSGAATSVLAALDLSAHQAVARSVELLDREAAAVARLLSVGATVELSGTAADTGSVLRVHDVPPRLLRAAPRRSDGSRLSEDWDGVRSRLTVALAAHGGAGTPTVLAPAQRRLLADVAGLYLEAEQLMSLGRVRELCWTMHRDHLDLRVRRWTSGGPGELDVLEVECRCAPADAGFLRPAVHSFVLRHGMDPGLGLDPLELRAATELTRATTPREPGT